MLSRSLSCHAGSALALALFANASTWAAPVPVVDTKSTSTSSGISREQLDSLPTGRRLEDLVRTCPSNTIPTVSRQPDVLIDGKPLVDINCVQPADIEMIEVYKEHNAVRAIYGASPLVWDPVLVLGAGGYVNQLSRTGRPVHSSREGRGTVRENLSQGLPGWDSMQLMGSWLNERQYFQPGTFPNVSTTGDWYRVGHYSQMIWPTTTLIGCARGIGMGSSWLICRYDPGGNKDGKTVGIPPLQTQQVAQAPAVNTTIRPRLIGGDYTGGAAQGANGHRASLFDLGIYGGGAWTSDWFEIAGNDPVIASTNLDQAAPQIADILFGNDATPALNHDYGYDSALFVGYDLGAFRLEAEVPYKRADSEANWDSLVNDVLATPADTFTGNIFIQNNMFEGVFFIPADPKVGLPALDFINAAENSLLTPPPESILDDVGDGATTPPPESILDDIGQADTKVEQPTLPTADVFARTAGQPDANSQADDSLWLQDRIRLNDYFSLNLGVRADAFDAGSGPPGKYLDFGIPRYPAYQDFGLGVGVPLTQNGSLNLAYIWLMSDTVTLNGAEMPYKDESTVRVWGADPVGLACKIDQAKIELDKKLAAGEWIDPAEYEKLHEEAMSEAKAGAEADEKAGGGVDATLYNQNLDKSQTLMKTAQDAAAKQTVDTKVQPAELPTQEVFNPADHKYSICDDVM
jgi:hypothetical protein